MSKIVDVIFAISLFSFLIVVGFYIVFLALAFDNGYLQYHSSRMILALLSKRTEDEYKALSESEATALGARWARRSLKVEELEKTKFDQHQTKIVAGLISDSDEEVAKLVRTIWKRSKEVNAEALSRLEVRCAEAQKQPVSVAIRGVERAISREQWKLWILGIRENFWSVVRGSERYSDRAIVAIVAVLVLLSVTKFVKRDEVGVAGDLVALAALVALLFSIGLSPAVALIQSLRRTMASQGSALPETRHDRRQVIRGRRLAFRLLPFAFAASFFTLYFGPLPVPVMPPSTVEPGTIWFRLGLCLIVVGILRYFLLPLWRYAVYALKPGTAFKVGPVSLYRDDQSSTVHNQTPVSVPTSVRLKALATTLFMGPIFVLMASFALLMALTSDGKIDSLVVLPSVRYLMLAIGLCSVFVAPLLFLAGAIAKKIEGRRRRRQYGALGLVTRRRTPPWRVWVIAGFVTLLVTWLASTLAPSGEGRQEMDLSEWARQYPGWFLLSLVLALAWSIGPIVLIAWTLYQSRRIRRDEAILHNEARLLLARGHVAASATKAVEGLAAENLSSGGDSAGRSPTEAGDGVHPDGRTSA